MRDEPTAMALRRLLPDPAPLTPEQAVAELALGDRAPADRPYVVANFVSSADGKASFHGRSGRLGGDVDRALFHRLRTQVDAVLVGSGTLRAERYGRLVRDPELRAAREAQGLAPDPLACVVSRSLELPLDIGLFQDPGQPSLVLTSSERQLQGLGPGVEVERVEAAQLTMTAALRRLRAGHGVRSVLAEGGPTVMGVLVAEDLVDELFLSLAPRLAGGGKAPTILEGEPLADLIELDLVWALEAGGELFLRYRLVTGPPPGKANA
jgi:riboflavin-specific deaminase-like protein